MNSKPKIYLASKLFRAEGWQHFICHFPEFDVISTWHNDPVQDLMEGELDTNRCRVGWTQNRTQVLAADALLAYGWEDDPLNGTMIEIGIAFGRGIPIYLVGDYPWGTWKHMGFVKHFPHIKPAVAQIIKDFNIDPA